MAGSMTAGTGSWQLEVAGRQHLLAETLRSLVAHAPLAPEVSWGHEISDVAARLERGSSDVAEIAALVAEMDAACSTVSKKLVRQPLLAARRINAALERLQATNTWSDVLRAAPAELCAVGDFDRVLFSRVEGSTWIPETWHAATDRMSQTNVAFGRFAKTARIPMVNGMIEAEIVRRRVTALVGDADSEARTFPPLIEVAHVRAYVIAPVVSGDAVVGLFHADANTSGRPLTEADRATIRAFADGVGLLLEKLALQERLQLQRTRIAEALAAAEHAVDELCSAPVLLSGGPESAVANRSALAAEPTAQGGLTTREREVFSLLVSGATNSQIANRLTVSETTVKSHVKHILRKLRASNRAEAIAKYLAMSNAQGRSA